MSINYSLQFQMYLCAVFVYFNTNKQLYNCFCCIFPIVLFIRLMFSNEILFQHITVRYRIIILCTFIHLIENHKWRTQVTNTMNNNNIKTTEEKLNLLQSRILIIINNNTIYTTSVYQIFIFKITILNIVHFAQLNNNVIV